MFIIINFIIFADVSDLQNFVNIALATAAGGEDDLTRDKLSNLRTIGSGFGSLIYKLPRTSGYKELVAGCKTLWETLEAAPRLPQIMVFIFNLLMGLCLYNYINACII